MVKTLLRDKKTSYSCINYIKRKTNEKFRIEMDNALADRIEKEKMPSLI